MVLPPVHRVAHDGNLEELLRLIHQEGPQLVNNIDDDKGFIPLHWACVKGHVSVVAALVDHGANLDHQNHYGTTAMYAACYKGHVPVVELLLEKGANPTLSTNHGVTPLMTASWKARVGVVTGLLHHPSVLSTINHCDDDGRTALYRAFCWEGHPDIVRMLLEAGADPTIRSSSGETAMDIATEGRHYECVSLLKEWDRSYTITKARLLYDAFCRYDHHNQQQDGKGYGVSTCSGGGGGGQASSAINKRPQVRAPTYLKSRVEGGQPLPKVEMVDYEEVSLVELVLEYVICDMKGELFVEFMEMMGKTGVRQREE